MVIKDRDGLTRAIKSAAAAQGISVKELGRRLGVVGPSISRTVNRSDIPFSGLLSIAAAIGCDLVISFKPSTNTTTTTDSGAQRDI